MQFERHSHSVHSTDRYGLAISQIPAAPIGFTSIVVCFLLVGLVESRKKLA
jgi:hypothetical protein